MTLLTVDWPAWFSYEWWRDVGIPVGGVLASTFIGVVALRVARRSNALAKETGDFAKAVKNAEDRRSEEERDKAARRERVEFVVLARRFNLMLRKDRLGEALPEDEMDADMYEAYLREVAATLDVPKAAEDLIDRMMVLFNPIRFGGEGKMRRPHAWAMWRTADQQIREYAAGRPVSEPYPREFLPPDAPSTPELIADIAAWNKRQDERRNNS
jgi:hypothetical protein